jgi:tyrosinase
LTVIILFFTVRPGQNRIRRRSIESSITIPFERTFRNLAGTDGTPNTQDFNFCGCGWPQHMLVPKGLPEGLVCDLFVMVSNYDLDRVDQSVEGVPCSEAASFCGIRDRLYPDKRPMGYPFDRMPRAGADNLATFLTPNMAVQQCVIVHSDTTSQRV